jgi:transcriptional regulator with GAF, ATPase, and Fis domain
MLSPPGFGIDSILDEYFPGNYRSMKHLLYCIVVIMLLTAQACTQRAWYEGVKQSHRNECHKAPPSERDECLRNTSDSYDEYQRKRREELK